MTDTTKSSEGQPPVRLAVFETMGTDKTHVATIIITEDGQGNWQVTLNGASESRSESSEVHPPVRLSLFETMGTDKTHVATIIITEDGQGNWQVTLNGASES